MPIIQTAIEDVMPRLKAYLARAGYRSALKDVQGETMAVARDVYEEALALAEPLAAVSDYRAGELDSVMLPEKLRGRASYSALLFSLAHRRGHRGIFRARRAIEGVFFGFLGLGSRRVPCAERGRQAEGRARERHDPFRAGLRRIRRPA